MNISEYNPAQTTPYSFKYKIRIYLWKLINKSVFRIIPNQVRLPRIILLRLFGADVSRTVNIHRNSNIEHPWNLKIGHLSSVGENAWIYCLDKVIIGQKCCIGKDVYLITGSHLTDSRTFQLQTNPIEIKDGCWVATGAYIMPGVVLESFTVVGARSLVIKNTNEFDIIAGIPAKFIKKRIFND